MAEDTYYASYSARMEPRIEGLLSRAETLVANDPYQRYEGERFAPFTEAQKQYFEQALAMGVDPRSLSAADLTQEGIYRLYNQAYEPTDFNFGRRINPAELENYQMGAQRGLNAPQDWRDEIDSIDAARGRYNQDLETFLMAKQRGIGEPKDWSRSAAQAKAAQGKYSGNLRNFNIGPIEDVKAREDLLNNYKRMKAAQEDFDANIKTRSFTTRGMADKYMSPYMQNVVDIQQREAQRQADIAAQSRGAEAVQAGAFGGSRQAIMEAEAARNLAQQKGDIQAKGLQESYTQAQAQFNQEQQAQLTAQQANQQARLQTTLSNLSNRQQAAVQNMAADLQMRGMSAEQALRAALANQQTELQREQSNQQGRLGVQALESQYRQQMAMQNLTNRQQTELANAANRFEAQGMTKQQAFDAAKTEFADRFAREQANLQSKMGTQELESQYRQQINMQNLSNEQQARILEATQEFEALGMTKQQASQYALAKFQDRFAREQANLEANLGIQQLRSSQDLTAQQFNKNLLMEAARMEEQSRQFGADYDYRSLMGGIQGAGQLGSQGQNIYGQSINNLNLVKGVGDAQQAGMQRAYDIEYQNFLDQQRYPYQQQEWLNSMYRGYANPTAIQGMYSQPPSMLNQAVGAGVALYGMNQQQQPGFSYSINTGGGNAAGGMISAGLMDLAVHKAKS